MVVVRPVPRARTLLLALLLVSISFLVVTRYRFFSALEEFDGLINHDAGSSDEYNQDLHIRFWRSFHGLLAKSRPNCNPPQRLGKADNIRFDAKEVPDRPELLLMPKDDILGMKETHAKFIGAIRDRPPPLYYVPGTRGLVTTAGGPYLPVLVVSLRMLRRTGSTLPMEVFLASPDEYEKHICDVVLPSLNARCIVLSDILDATPKAAKIHSYQFKPFAMLFSSFEDMLFLDADAFPLYDPEPLFKAEPYRSKHMVMWPDFWYNSASPYYYQIAGQKIPPMDLRQSTESGELMISKRTHRETLLLATYYNYYGPTHYYPLLSQGASGEGDKETFLAAAVAVEQTFYQVSEMIVALGRRQADGDFAGSAMHQFDPREDWKLTQKGLWRIKDASVAPMPRGFFIHANFPKFNPATIFSDGNAVKPVQGEDGSDVRAWTIPEDLVKGWGYDVEEALWREMKWVACKLEDKFESWEGKSNICNDATRYWTSMYGSKT